MVIKERRLRVLLLAGRRDDVAEDEPLVNSVFVPYFDLSGMAKKKKSLRNALNTHQVKMFQQRQLKAVEAHKKAGLKKDLAKGKDRVARKSVIPYNAQDTVLLIGEGALSSLEHDLY